MFDVSLGQRWGKKTLGQYNFANRPNVGPLRWANDGIMMAYYMYDVGPTLVHCWNYCFLFSLGQRWYNAGILYAWCWANVGIVLILYFCEFFFFIGPTLVKWWHVICRMSVQCHLIYPFSVQDSVNLIPNAQLTRVDFLRKLCSFFLFFLINSLGSVCGLIVRRLSCQEYFYCLQNPVNYFHFIWH